MNRPKLDVDQEVISYIEYLEEKLTEYQDNGMIQMYRAVSRKMHDLADAIDDATISLKEDDKSFERLMKTLIESRGIAENLVYLEQKLGIDQKEVEVKEKNKFKNPSEFFAKNAKASKQGTDE